MKYQFITDWHPKTGEPIWKIAKCYGFRRKNHRDQVFVRSENGKMIWIFATIVTNV